jgi:hypothetical protein
MGNYEEARKFNVLLLDKEPQNMQAQSLETLIEQKVQQGEPRVLLPLPSPPPSHPHLYRLPFFCSERARDVALTIVIRLFCRGLHRNGARRWRRRSRHPPHRGLSTARSQMIRRPER